MRLSAEMSKLFVVGLMAVFWTSGAAAQQKGAPTVSLSPRDVESYARVLQMADTRSFDGAVLQQALDSGSAPVRAAASLAAAQVVRSHREQALPLLRNLLTDQDTAVAANAAFGLGLGHDSASVGALVDAIRRVSSGGNNRPWPVAEAAARALGEIGDPARASLSLLLTDKLPSRTTIALLLAEARLKPIDATAVIPHLRDKNLGVVWAASYAIARQHSSAGIRALLTLPKTDWMIRMEVARALTADAVDDSLQQDALQMLSDLAHDDYPQVRVQAVRSSATYGHIARLQITQAVHDDDPNVRIAAAEVAGLVMGRDLEDWRELWDADTSFRYQRSLVEASVQAGAPFPELTKWRTSPEWRYRAAAVTAWRSSPDTVQAKTAALLASYDRDGRVRAAAYDLLVSIDPNRRDTVVQNLLRLAEADSDQAAREALPWYKRTLTALDSQNLNRPFDWYVSVVRDIVIPALNGPPYSATMVTDRGTIRLALLCVQAPLTVRNFIVLANRGFYNGLRFHRVVPAFIAQDGDPRGDGNGGPGYVIRDELTREQYRRGAVGMALSGPDTGGSQYFLTLTPQPHLYGQYPLFAHVVSGMAAMDALVEGDLIKAVTVP